MEVEYEEFLRAGPEGSLGPGRVARRLPDQGGSLLLLDTTHPSETTSAPLQGYRVHKKPPPVGPYSRAVP